MKLIVFADNHGALQPLQKIVDMHPDAYTFIHLGDNQHTIAQLKASRPQIHIVAVSGNCDFDPELVSQRQLVYKGKKIWCVHGHQHGVKGGVGALQQQAKSNGFDLVLFAHTHVRYSNYLDGVYYFNPGSCARPRDGMGNSYGVIEIRDNGVLMSHGTI